MLIVDPDTQQSQLDIQAKASEPVFSNFKLYSLLSLV
jgi:hypothetical protein